MIFLMIPRGKKKRTVQPVIIKTHDFAEAERADILQQVMMSAEERQEAARILRERHYGTGTPDIRKSRRG
jgi:hypothetical protein